MARPLRRWGKILPRQKRSRRPVGVLWPMRSGPRRPGCCRRALTRRVSCCPRSLVRCPGHAVARRSPSKSRPRRLWLRRCRRFPSASRSEGEGRTQAPHAEGQAGGGDFCRCDPCRECRNPRREVVDSQPAGWTAAPAAPLRERKLNEYPELRACNLSSYSANERGSPKRHARNHAPIRSS
jgi:hypothetical protein